MGCFFSNVEVKSHFIGMNLVTKGLAGQYSFTTYQAEIYVLTIVVFYASSFFQISSLYIYISS